jgi:Phage capsid family
MPVKDHIQGLIEKRQQIADDLETLISGEDYDPDGPAGEEFRSLQTEALAIDKRVEHGREVAELRAKGSALVQRSGAYPDTDIDPSGDIGAQLIASPTFKSWKRAGATGRAKLMEIPMRRALITSATIPPTSSRVNAPEPAIRNLLLNALTKIQVATGSVDVLKYGPATGAGVVAEGALKPEGILAPTVTPQTVPTIAAWAEAVRQVIEDETRLRDFITNSLMRGVYAKVESEAADVIEGGTGYQTATGDNGMSAIRNGVALVQSAGWSPNAILLNPLDAAAVDYDVWNNTSGQSSSVWGLQVIASPAIAAGTGFVADFSAAFQHYYRGAADVFVSDSDVGTDGISNFKRNIITFLVEYRGLTVVVRPDAVAKVTVTTPPIAQAAGRGGTPQQAPQQTPPARKDK